ncbi:MAG TPA: hypothetical protein VF451_04325 [Acidobacteriota bacterium]
MPHGKERTLKLQWPFGRTLLLAFVILAGLVAAAELLLRREFLQSRLPYPSFCNSNHQLDIKLHLLDKMVEREGPPDCLFLGNSTVQAGIDPEAFNEAYRKFTGNSLRCFNFGVVGMAPDAGATLIRILNRRYRPRMVIWGIIPYDLKARGKNKESMLENGNWVRFQMGYWDFSGWLTETSYLYRYYLRFRLWLDFPGINRNIEASERHWSANGFNSDRYGSFITDPEQRGREARNKETMRNFKVNQHILSMMHEAFQPTPGVTFVLVEMPLHPNYVAQNEEEEKAYGKHLSLISGFAGRKNLHFIRRERRDFFMDDHWRNALHLNYRGAVRFSRWLGERIGVAVKKGLIPDPRRHGQRS